MERGAFIGAIARSDGTLSGNMERGSNNLGVWRHLRRSRRAEAIEWSDRTKQIEATVGSLEKMYGTVVEHILRLYHETWKNLEK